MNHYNQPHYTLPGVMHYLQTEFTKNERDRITWDLERLEMKSYINKLESENRDLRHKLAALQFQTDSSGNSIEDGIQSEQGSKEIDALMDSRLRVQENVKEIIYLLNGPNITSDLNTITNRNIPLHEMEDLNLNNKVKTESTMDPSLKPELHDDMVAKEYQPVTNDSSNEDGHVESLFNKDINPGLATDEHIHHSIQHSDVDDLQSDTTEVPPIDEADVFNEDSIPIHDEIDIPHEKIQQQLLPQILKVYKNKILATLNNQLKYYLIEEDSSCRDMGVTFDSLLDSMEIKGIYWVNERMVMFVLNDGVFIWNVSLNTLVKRFPLFDDLKLNFNDIISTDYKNKWLLLTTRTGVHVIEWDWNDEGDEDGEDIFVINKYNIPVQRCLNSILGITEKSFMVIVNNPFKLIIYNFNGEILQTVNMNKEVSKKRITNDIKLYLNKDSSKLMIQLKRHLVLYSFEQKRIIQQKTLPKTPTSIYFKYNDDVIGVAYNNGSVELRKLQEFDKIIYQYPHLATSFSPENNDTPHEVSIEATLLEDKHIFLSLGDNVLKLETAEI